MNKIKILDESISNIIAAGEVVENPASMVKELIENSLDAKAKSIRVEVRNSGRNVRIVDTGTGMGKEDLFLCVERHATSKISDKNDIFNLTSYGFRGEALASIGSISKLVISSKNKESQTGHKINLNAGKVTRYYEVSRSEGTEIEIKDLFFNTPARLKFLRKKSTEYARLREIVLKEALYNVNVAFSLTLDDREVIRTSGKGIQNTILELFGRNTLKNSKEFSLGYWGNMELLKSNKESIYTFVNGRYVKSKTIEKAVIDAYYTKLVKGKYPFAIIFFEIAPDKVDVNVHPSKKIVKFVDEEGVYKEILETLKAAIYEDDRSNSVNLVGHIEEIESGEKENNKNNEKAEIGEVSPTYNSAETIENDKKDIAQEILGKKDEENPESNGSFIDFKALEGMIESNFVNPSKEEKIKNEVPKTEQGAFTVPEPTEEELKTKVEERIKKATAYSQAYEEFVPEIDDFEIKKNIEKNIKKSNIEDKNNLESESEVTLEKGKILKKEEAIEIPKEKLEGEAQEKQELKEENSTETVGEPIAEIEKIEKNEPVSVEKKRNNYKIIGQLRNMYILVETNNELEIYDQHIVHERILYEKLKEEHYKKSISMQNLLVPIKLELTGYEIEIIRDNFELFNEFGFEVEEFGDNEILIRGIPIFDFRESVEDTFRYLLENLDGGDPREKVLISMSCKNAIKAGKKLTPIEMETLVEDLHKIGKYTCPHGRPIILKMDFYEMDKKFNRK